MPAAYQKAWKQQRRPQISERSLQSQVFEYLDLALPSGAVSFSVPNGDRKMTTAPGMLAGVPDICIIYDKRPFFIELKSDAGRVEPHQRAVHERLTGAGAVVAVCRSVEEVRDLLAQLMPLRGRLT